MCDAASAINACTVASGSLLFEGLTVYTPTNCPENDDMKMDI